MSSSVSITPDTSPAERRALRLSLIDGVLYAIMLGCSESYLGALAVELGHGGTTLAILMTVPLLLGAAAQLLSGALVTWVGSRRRLVAAGALVQALTHLGFMWIALTGHASLWPFLIFKSAFWISGTLIAPPWAGWMASLLRPYARERYFAYRSACLHLALVGSYWLAGLFLNDAHAHGRILPAFTVLMLLALLARGLSALTLGLQGDPHGREQPQLGPPAKRLRDALHGGRWRVAVYIAALGFGAHVAVPFFTPYMLNELKLDYRTYALLTTASISAKAVFFPFCHKLSARVGLRAMLTGGGTAVATIPYLWSLAPGFHGLVLLHILSGTAWAAVEFTSFQLLLGSAKDEWRVEYLALAGALAGLLQVTGSLVGGQLLDRWGLGYREVFVVSSVARGLPLLLLVTLPVALLPRRLPKLVFRLFGVGAGVGQSLRPVIEDKPSVPPDAGDVGP